MRSVFVLRHVRSSSDDAEEVKFIGVYSSGYNARAAVDRLVMAPGFSENPDGFAIDEYPLDQDHWVEGFVTAFHPVEIAPNRA